MARGFVDESERKKPSEIFFKEGFGLVLTFGGWGEKKKKKPCSTGHISASLSRFLFLSFTDLHLIEADNGQERHGEK